MAKSAVKKKAPAKRPAKTKAATKAKAAKKTSSKNKTVKDAPATAKASRETVKTKPKETSSKAQATKRTRGTSEQQPVTKPKTAPRKKTTRSKKPVVLPPDYSPTDDEPFMGDVQREYFRQKLTNWREEINRQTKQTLEELNQDSQQHADLADRATSETDRALDLRARDRQRKLVNKINAALARIDDGSYGYCEETGEPIGLKRLDARPIATLSLEAQERHERRERVYRED